MLADEMRILFKMFQKWGNFSLTLKFSEKKGKCEIGGIASLTLGGWTPLVSNAISSRLAVYYEER